MPVIKFVGRVIPKVFQISIGGHPTVNWKDEKRGIDAKFDLAIEKNNLTVTFQSNKSDAEHISEAVVQATNIAEATVSLATFREGLGFTAIIDRAEFEDGRIEPVATAEKRVQGLATAIKSDKDFSFATNLLLLDPVLMLAVRDLADSIRHVHSAAINCGRAIDAICTYFIREGEDRRDGWPRMREALNIDEAYLKTISDISKGPRHGQRSFDIDPLVTEAGIRVWTIMNRFFEFLKRNRSALPIAEFPTLK